MIIREARRGHVKLVWDWAVIPLSLENAATCRQRYGAVNLPVDNEQEAFGGDRRMNR